MSRAESPAHKWQQHFGRAALERPVGDSWHAEWPRFRLARLGDVDPPNIRRSISLAVNGLEHRKDEERGPGEESHLPAFLSDAGGPILLVASLERTPPEAADIAPEPVECSTVCRHRVIFKEAGYDFCQAAKLDQARLARVKR
jgi:hypothetical protein